MQSFPLISIVTPSFNQGRYLAETLQSLLNQDYPKLEVIIQDGGSTDGAIAVAQGFVRQRPDVFQLHVETDSGQADALNRGFSRARGDILGFLNSDDTLYPGCLRSVAREIDPSRRRWIVFGRCLFTGEDSPYVGVEHPAEYRSHFEQLAIWKRGYNTLPQPSVFWQRRVWKKSGGFNVAEHHVLDYDLFCRFSQKFRFHKVDELWSTYRMHAVSKSAQRTETEILDLSIQVSRRYWGPWWSPLRWRCELSHWLHDRHLHEHARHHARQTEENARTGHKLAALGGFFKTLAYSPRMARDRLLRAWISAYRLKFLERLFWATEEGFTGHYGDLWIGPVYRTQLAIPAAAKRLVLYLKHTPSGSHTRVNVIFKINRHVVERRVVDAETAFSFACSLVSHRGKQVTLEMCCDSFFRPKDVHGTPDERPLSLQLLETTIESESGIG